MEFVQDLPAIFKFFVGAPIGALATYLIVRPKIHAQAHKTTVEANNEAMRGEMKLTQFLQSRNLELEKMRADQADLIIKQKEELNQERKLRKKAESELLKITKLYTTELKKWKVEKKALLQKIQTLKGKIDKMLEQKR